MKIFLAGSGHTIEKTPFVNRHKNPQFLLSYQYLSPEGTICNYQLGRFKWIIEKKLKNKKASKTLLKPYNI